MTVNPISAITGATTDLILKDDLVRDLMSRRSCWKPKPSVKKLAFPLPKRPEDRHAVTLKLGRI